MAELSAVLPQKPVEHVTYRVPEGSCVHLGGLARYYPLGYPPTRPVSTDREYAATRAGGADGGEAAVPDRLRRQQGLPAPGPPAPVLREP
eukprot:2601848-Rhodomonas_salina.1